jgi:hypothetical protein
MKQRIGAVKLLLRRRAARDSKVHLPELLVSPMLVLVLVLRAGRGAQRSYEEDAVNELCELHANTSMVLKTWFNLKHASLGSGIPAQPRE